MKTEESKQEYERQLASLPPLVRLKIEQMDERAYAQEIVIAWLLSQMQKIPGLPKDHAQRFLARQANLVEEESGPGPNTELVLLIDELRLLVADFDASE